MEWIAPAVVLVGVMGIWFTVGQLQSRLERTERKLNALLKHFGLEASQGDPLSDRVRELARDPAGKIEAIKLHREETGAGLAQAKNAVESFIYSQ